MITMYDTWINEMTKEIEKDNSNPENPQALELKESDLDKIADRVISKLSTVSTPKSENEDEADDIETKKENKDEEKEN